MIYVYIYIYNIFESDDLLFIIYFNKKGNLLAVQKAHLDTIYTYTWLIRSACGRVIGGF